MIILPVSVGLIVSLFAFLTIRENQTDPKMCAVLLLRYSTCLLFAIVGALYFRSRGMSAGFWIIAVLDPVLSLLMGKDIRDAVKSKEITEESLRIVQRTSFYLMGLSFGLVAAVLVSM